MPSDNMQKAVARQWVNHILGSVASAKAYKSTRAEVTKELLMLNSMEF